MKTKPTQDAKKGKEIIRNQQLNCEYQKDPTQDEAHQESRLG